MKRYSFTLLLIGLSLAVAFGQSGKKPIDFTHYDSWKTLSGQKISNDGNLVTWMVNPHVGDGNLFLRGWDGDQEVFLFSRGSQAQFSPSSNWLAFKISPQSDTVRQAKIKKAKPEKMPKDSLGIYVIGSQELIRYPLLKSFRVADKPSRWIAFQQEEQVAEVKGEKRDTTEGRKKEEEPKSKKKSEYNGLPLVVMDPVTRDSLNFPKVTEYFFSKDGKWLCMIGIEEDSLPVSTIRIFETGKATERVVWTKTGVAKGLICDENATQLAFLFTTDTTKSKNYSLYFWSAREKEPLLVADSLTAGMPEGWSVSENGRLRFSPGGGKLFFGTAVRSAAEEEKKDSTLADDKVSVDIWHWQEDVLQSMQLNRVNQERRKNYQAVYHVKKRQMVQLEHPEGLESVRLFKEGDLDLALGIDDKAYRLANAINSTSWRDYYLVDLNNGNRELLFRKASFSPGVSQEGLYLYWWEPADSSYYSYRIDQKTTVNLTGDLGGVFASETHDTPDEPRSYGVMGWASQDRWLYLYDRYDIWRIQPDGKVQPLCITGGEGRKSELSYRYVSLDAEEKTIDPSKMNLFSVSGARNKQSGFSRFTLDKPDLTPVVMQDVRFSNPVKATDSDRVIWTRSTVSEYPDVWCSDLNFNGARKLSEANPQQGEYLWATVELVEWLDLGGQMCQGLLYKPENFDPSRKYPLIVYFYERHSDGLHTHYVPRASASTVNPLEYTSNGYLIFMPDTRFFIGNPGKSFYNSIMSGLMYLNQRGFVDMDRLGIQGQSWGGYGTAFLITQTDIFKAASPGAPVSNMTSAYGGIRTESGMVRQFQYEKTQSRIGGNLWEKPELFIENSPLFFADRINTPCLIRHDDADGAVPFAEGVQLFVALRRLGKPAWLVNYNNAPHNLSRQADKKDWSVRMMQFFNHYLKEEPAPEWMTNGVKAIDKKGNELYYKAFTEK
ncbi:MAG: prolyl oligopeptidase family serine peptidase [Bacteroidales bacterium]